jgi:hypothetical protein
MKKPIKKKSVIEAKLIEIKSAKKKIAKKKIAKKSVKRKKRLTKIQAQIAKEAKEIIKEKDSFRFLTLSDLESNPVKVLKKTSEKLHYGSTLVECQRLVDDFKIIELPPSTRIINLEYYDIFSSSYEVRTLYLSFPYLQFAFLPQGPRPVSLSCSNVPISNLNSMVYAMCLPNSDNYGGNPGGICMGKYYGWLDNNKVKNPASKYIEVINDFFSRKFNDSHGDSIIFPKDIKNFSVWEKRTRLEPEFVTKVKWNGETSLAAYLAEFL